LTLRGFAVAQVILADFHQNGRADPLCEKSGRVVRRSLEDSKGILILSPCSFSLPNQPVDISQINTGQYIIRLEKKSPFKGLNSLRDAPQTLKDDPLEEVSVFGKGCPVQDGFTLLKGCFVVAQIGQDPGQMEIHLPVRSRGAAEFFEETPGFLEMLPL